MPLRGATKKQQRQYEHIKESAAESGRSPRRAKQIAAATVNKSKSTKKKGAKKSGAKKRTGKKKSTKKATRRRS
jgi:SOS-response transcriptional repressor LexA